jgi:ferrous iron transport protein B
VEKPITIAVAGNPNSGKSTLINAIAGTRLHVGNWPGVTVEKKTASFDYEGRQIDLVDLPGTYSLSPYSQEEVVARDYIIEEKPDVILNVIDATNLERNLYFTIQLMELGIPIVAALNVFDEAEKKGFSIDTKVMEELLAIPVVKTVATKKTGLDTLFEKCLQSAIDPAAHVPKTLNYGDDIESAAGIMRPYIEKDPALQRYPARWLVFKLMEGDSLVREKVKGVGLDSLITKTAAHLKKAHNEDIESIMADIRYGLAAGLCREVMKKRETGKRDLTERIDEVVLNRFLGIPIFFIAMWLIFKLTFDISKPFSDWMGNVINGPLTAWTGFILASLSIPVWTRSLITDGIIAGVGSVFVFVPVIFTVMFFITFLEGSGYMARAAFIIDRAMHTLGLHGKSFIPMILGFGCNVPAVYATRTLESSKDKALTALLIPLMSCGARLPVYILFIGVFFPAQSGTILWSLYMAGIDLAVIMGIIFKNTLFRGEAPVFIMELPPYRMPSFQGLVIHTWEKGKHFMIKAGTYILALSVIVWFLLNLPWGISSKQNSYLGMIGSTVAPVLEPLGFGTWEATSSLITGFVAKEIIVGTMGEVYAGEAKEEPAVQPSLSSGIKEIGFSFAGAVRDAISNIISTFTFSAMSSIDTQEKPVLKEPLRKGFTPLSAYAFIMFVLLYTPCGAVIFAMKQEFGTWKWGGIAVAYQLILAWSCAFLIYQGGSLIGLGG